jgi:Patatin-like phospholipase
MQALQVHAGPRALRQLRERGLQAADVRVVPAAAGGPKGLVLLPLDHYIFGHWLPQSQQTVHLMGASIGAWRMAAACAPSAEKALTALGEDYITQTYPHAPGKMPTASSISQGFVVTLQRHLGDVAAQLLAHPRFRLHVLTSRGQRLLHRPGAAAMPAGWLAAFVANATSRQALGNWMQRVVFSDPRDTLPFALNDYPTHTAALTAHNLAPAVLASCSIPFALLPVQDVPGGPLGTYWDGGITDYHLHLNYAAMAHGLVLYPHFGSQVVPGWLDKALKKRHKATPFLDNLVLLSPQPGWVRSLPNGKLPDRTDFKSYLEDEKGRQRDWRVALAESQRLADEFAELVASGLPIQAQPLV